MFSTKLGSDILLDIHGAVIKSLGFFVEKLKIMMSK